MISKIWFYLSNGLPLWSRTINKSSPINEDLVSGILTAATTFAGEALGSELRDLLLKDKILHQYEMLKNNARVAILMDERVSQDKIDLLLKEADKILLARFSLLDIKLEQHSNLVIAQKTKPLIAGIMDGVATQLLIFNQYYEQLYNTTKDDNRPRFIEKLDSLLPYMMRHNLNTMIHDIETKKIYFEYKFTNINKELQNDLLKMLKPFEESYTLFSEANLLNEIAYILVGSLEVAQFCIANYVFTIFARKSIGTFDNFQTIVENFRTAILALITEQQLVIETKMNEISPLVVES